MNIGNLIHRITFLPDYHVFIYTGHDLSSVSYELWRGKSHDIPIKCIGYEVKDWNFWSEVEHGTLTIVVNESYK